MRPLVFVVHVPKTAGSTINSYLREHDPNGHAHCEAVIRGDDDKLREAAESFNWMSGHIDFTTAEARLKAVTDRPVRFFSCMRQPFRQVMSHYNWLIEIYHKGGSFYENHSEKIKEISQNVRSGSDSIEAIQKNLLRHHFLFLNGQSRYILGREFNWNTGKVYDHIAKYDTIADSSNVNVVLERILGKPVDVTRRDNASTYRFDTSLFENDAMRRFLKRENLLDETLYEIVVSEAPGCAESATPKWQLGAA